jgi:hypothetical protein
MGTTVAFLAIPWASLVCAAATLVLAIAAFTSRTWRKPFEVLLWSGAAGLAMIAASNAVRLRVPLLFAHGHRVLVGNTYALLFQTGLLVLAFACSRMHTLLLRQPAAD